MEHNTQFLETEPVGRLMRRYALPCVISLLVGALYNIVDQIFIANASYLGSYGNAANTVVFPLTVVGAGHRRQHRQSHTITVEQTAVVSLSKRTSPA